MTDELTQAIDLAVSNMAHMPHLDAVAHLPALFTAESGGAGKAPGRLPFRAAVFNMERGDRPERFLPYLTLHPALRGLDVLFANELDDGMLRSGNRHTAREIAETLGMYYVYGVEFISTRAGRDGNREGRHGNAIFSRFPILRTKLLRLPIENEWFHNAGDPRLGTRNAILAEIDAAGTRVGLCCTHLENRTTPAGRARQMQYLLSEMDAFFGRTLPVLLGGDMNTNTVNGAGPRGGMDDLYQNEAEQARRMGRIPDFEPLMDIAAAAGYSYRNCNLINKSTRRKPMPDGSVIRLNLDWFFARGLACSVPLRVETVFDHTALSGAPVSLARFDGQELSDHDAITVTCGVQP